MFTVALTASFFREIPELMKNFCEKLENDIASDIRGLREST